MRRNVGNFTAVGRNTNGICRGACWEDEARRVVGYVFLFGDVVADDCGCVVRLQPDNGRADHPPKSLAANDPLHTRVRFLRMAGIFYFSVGASADAQRAHPSHDGLVWRCAGRSDSSAWDLDCDHDEPDQDDGESYLRCGVVYACAVSGHRLFYDDVRVGDLLAEKT